MEKRKTRTELEKEKATLEKLKQEQEDNDLLDVLFVWFLYNQFQKKLNDDQNTDDLDLDDEYLVKKR